MKCVIMAGGFGTRLRPLTQETPKPMVPIVGKPLLEHIISHVKSYGIDDIYLTLGYHPEKIVGHFKDGRDFGVNLKYFIEKTPLGTAGSVKNAVDFEGDFLVLSGDALTNIDIKKLVEFHKKTDALCTMAVKKIENPRGFGIVEINENGEIVSFLEKPEAAPKSAFVNTGIYVMNTRILKHIPDGNYDFSRNLFPSILSEMKAFKTSAYWSDIGTLETYYTANLHVVKNARKFGFVW